MLRRCYFSTLPTLPSRLLCSSANYRTWLITKLFLSTHIRPHVRSSQGPLKERLFCDSPPCPNDMPAIETPPSDQAVLLKSEDAKKTTWAYVREKLTSYHLNDQDQVVNGWEMPIKSGDLQVSLSGSPYYSKGTGTYIGPVKDGFFEGVGRLYDPHSFSYGIFKKSRQVSGIRRFQDGTQYKGQLQDGLAHGWSSITYPDKSVLKGIFDRGTFVRGTFVGKGAFKLASGTASIQKKVHFDPAIG